MHEGQELGIWILTSTVSRKFRAGVARALFKPRDRHYACLRIDVRVVVFHICRLLLKCKLVALLKGLNASLVIFSQFIKFLKLLSIEIFRQNSIELRGFASFPYWLR